VPGGRQRLPEGLQQLLHPKRLEEVGAGAFLHGVHVGGDVPEGGDQDDGRFRTDHAHPRQEIQPGQPRHVLVQDDGGEGIGSQADERLRPVRCLHHVVALVTQDVHFEIPQTDLIPNVAAVRASCNVTASGEPLALRANETARTTIGAAPGPCSIVLVLFGLDVGLPLVNTTPLGRSSFFIPGIATATFGLVDVTLDLVTSLNSTTRVEDPRLATVDPTDVAWSAWGIALLDVQAADGFGSNATSALNTTFVYTMALAVSVFALSVEIFHADLTAIGSVIGTPSLRTDLSVDLRPHALVLGPLSEVRHDGATFAWAGSVDPDVDHLELFVTDGTRNASYRLGPAASTVSVPLVPSTHYTAWIVAVDGSGQATPSNVIVFVSLESTASATSRSSIVKSWGIGSAFT